jgi:glutaminyl-peptide cyclotransferase
MELGVMPLGKMAAPIHLFERLRSLIKRCYSFSPPGVFGAFFLLGGCDSAFFACDPPEEIGFDVEGTFERSRLAFTQGLEFYGERLFESTGAFEGSTELNEISLDEAAGWAEVSSIVSHGKAVFGEGLTILADRIFQLTWKDNLIFEYAIDTFEPRARGIAINGWGLTNDGRRLIASDGSDTLYFFDPDTLAELGTMKVKRKTWGLARPQAMINEIEMVGQKIFANIYRSNEIVQIDLKTGCVEGVADFSRLYDELNTEQKRQVDSHSNNVLNGIAYSKERGTFFLTGKRWPLIFEVRMDIIART